MIQAVMVMSTQGKPRLLKFYSYQPPEKHQDLVRGVFQLLSARPDSVSNFVKVDAIFGPGAKLVYKHLATLYFVFVFDSSENELAVLDLVQVFVETLDRCFKNVCELDIVFNFNKAGETVKHNQPHTEVDFRAFQPLSRESFTHVMDRNFECVSRRNQIAFFSSRVAILSSREHLPFDMNMRACSHREYLCVSRMKLRYE
uniref:AP complex mu/sigma subunit domain-containing protein n=2 Tax=Oryza meridionalis TaxID=40149 RepID=A0A0E0CXH6_9ORYZ